MNNNNNSIIIKDEELPKERIVPQTDAEPKKNKRRNNYIFEKYSSPTSSEAEQNPTSPLEKAKDAIERVNLLLNSLTFFGNNAYDDGGDLENISETDDFLSFLGEKRKIPKIVSKSKAKIQQEHSNGECTTNNSGFQSLTINPATRQLEHIVGKEDTLEGIAVKYGVTVPELMKANNLWTRNAIYSKRTLIIPVRVENYLELMEKQKEQLKETQQIQQKMAERFVNETQCEPAVAVYYLEESHYNYDK